MTDQLILNDPVGRLLQLLNRMKEVDPSKRLVIGLVGLLGSGKSTLAAKFVDEVNVRTNATWLRGDSAENRRCTGWL